MTEKWVESERGRTYYWISRRVGRPVLVFLHGLTADHTLFDKQVEYFSRRFTVIVWDSPAHGKSRPYRDFSYLHCAVELKHILDQEQIRRAVMIGQSMGGYQIQAFLEHWPEQVRGFAAIDSCPFGKRYYSKSDLWWLRQMEWMTRLFPLRLLRRAVAHSVGRTQYARENMRAALAIYGKDELCHLLGQGYLAFARENADLRIECPAILLVGAHDRTGKVRHYCAAWSREAQLPLFTIRSAAHNSNADNPVLVNRILHAFFNHLPAELEETAEIVDIREMRAEDWPRVREIYAQALETGRATFQTECPDYAEWDAAHRASLRCVAVKNGTIAGWCALAPTSARAAYAGVNEVSIYVDPAYCDRGIGTELLKKLCRESEKQGVWTLYAAVLSDNSASISLFESCGFRRIGTRERIARDRFGKWRDTVLFERRSRLI